MNADEFMQHLISLVACNEATDWANGKSWREVYDTCHRGDWLLWLYLKSKGYDFQKLTLAKGLCANTVRHLMKDERSLKAVDTAIAFGRGEINIDELNAAATYATAATAATYATAATAATYATAATAAVSATAAAAATYYAAAAAYYAAASATYYAADSATAAAAAAYYAADSATAAAARKENQQKTADIVREVLPFEIWEF